MSLALSSTAAELLLHFFQFYAHQFVFSDVVAIHCNPAKRLTSAEAIELAMTEYRHPTDCSTPFRVAHFHIQDPLDLSHNLAKSLGHASLNIIKKHLKCACCILQEELQNEATPMEGEKGGTEATPMEGEKGGTEAVPMEGEKGGTEAAPMEEEKRKGNLFALFDHSRYNSKESLPSETPAIKPKLIKLNPAKMSCLLQKLDQFRPLASRLGELDLSNPGTVAKLNLIALRAMVALLEEMLSFTCVPLSTEESSGASLELSIGRSSSELSFPSDHDSSMAVGDPTPEADHDQVVGDPTPEADVVGDPTPEADPTMSIGSQVPADSVELVESRKRHRSDPTDTSDLTPVETEDPKRVKLFPHSPALDLLYAAAKGVSNAYTCSVYSTTWKHQRSQRRHQLHSPIADPEATSMDGLAQSLPEVAPVLQVILAAVRPSLRTPAREETASQSPSFLGQKIKIANVQLTPTNLSYVSEFTTFFGYFKKLVTS